MIIVNRSDLKEIETPGGNFGTGIATPNRGAVETSVIRQRQRPGGANPLHSHDREETTVVIAGTITVATAGKSVPLRAGEAVIVAPGEAHRVENSGEEDAEWLLISTAGVRFIRENGDDGSPPWAL